MSKFRGLTESANEWKKTANHSVIALKLNVLAWLFFFFLFLLVALFFCFVFMKYLSGDEGKDGFCLLSFCIMRQLIANFGAVVMLEAASLKWENI